MRIALALCVLLVVGLAACKPGDLLVVYVAPPGLGSDAADGLSPETPVETLGQAQEILRGLLSVQPANAEIRVAPGTYVDQTVLWDFTMPNHSIRILPQDPTTRPVFAGGGAPLQVWLDVVTSPGRPTRLHVEGLHIQGYWMGIRFRSRNRSNPERFSSQNVIRDNWFTEIGQGHDDQFGLAAVDLVNSDDNLIEGNYFRTLRDTVDCGKLHAVYMAHGTERNVIRGNVFEDGCGDPIKFRDASDSNLVLDNTFVDIGVFTYAVDSYCDQTLDELRQARLDWLACVEGAGSEEEETGCYKDHIRCTKGASLEFPPTEENLECPSGGNVFADNRLSGGFGGITLEATLARSADEVPGCDPAPGPARIVESGNTSPAARPEIASSQIFAARDGRYGGRVWQRLNDVFPASAHRVVGDFDGDGDDDVAQISNEGGLSRIRILRTGPTGFELVPMVDDVPGSSFQPHHRWFAADRDGDGQDELLLIYSKDAQSKMQILEVRSDRIEHARYVELAASFRDEHHWIVGDYNGDGADDLALVYSYGGESKVFHYRAEGGGYTRIRAHLMDASFAENHVWRAGDFDGDGRDDLVLIYPRDGRSRAFTYHSTGTSFQWLRVESLNTAFESPATQQWLAGDVNRDGRDDLVLAYSYRGDARALVLPSYGNDFGLEGFDGLGATFLADQVWLGGAFLGDDGMDLVKLYGY